MSTNVPPMTPEALEAIRARLAAATPGPWVDVGDTELWPGMVLAADTVTPICCDPEGDDRPADRALIANAPADLATLLAEVERLRGAAPKKAPWVTPDGCDHDGAPEVAPLDDCVRCGGIGLLAPEVVCCCACSECRAEYDNA